MLTRLSADLTCLSPGWAPGLHRLSPADWAALALGAGAVIAAVAARRALDRPGAATLPAERILWRLVPLWLLAILLARPLDAQSLLTGLLRCDAELHGWYGHRRSIQGAALICTALAGALAAGLGLWALRAQIRRNAPALLCLILLSLFFAGRSVSLHGIDALLHLRIAGTVDLNRLFEFAATGGVIWGALRLRAAALTPERAAARAARRARQERRRRRPD